MDDSPKGLWRELTTTVWNRRIILVALAVLLAQSGLRLINSLLAFVIVPLLSNILKNTDSVLFRSDSRFAWDPLIYSLLEFGLVVIVVIFGSRGMRRARPGAAAENHATEELSESPISADEDSEPGYTITGNLVSPTEQSSPTTK